MTTCKRRLLLVPFLLLLLAPATALAEQAAPQWSVSSVSRPTNFKPGGDAGGDAYLVIVTNTGDEPSAGPITITDELPAGLAPAPGASGFDELASKHSAAGANFSHDCGPTGSGFLSCTYSGVVQPDDTLVLSFPVEVSAAGSTANSCQPEPGAVGCALNMVRASGGGALAAAMQTPTQIDSEPATFGIPAGGASTALSSVQAGAHPDLSVSAAFSTVSRDGLTAGSFKNTTYDLPAGFAGDLVDTPACPAGQFLAGSCPIATQVGVTTVIVASEAAGLGEVNFEEPVYNLAPDPGYVSKLGFSVGTDNHYEGDVSVRAPGQAGEYGLQTTFYDATAGILDIDNVSLTVWGVPADPVHDALRWNPAGGLGSGHFGVSSDAAEAPFLTNPTACGTEPLEAAFKVTSWQQPEESQHPIATKMPFGPIVGCDALVMDPSLTAEVTSDAAYSPTGFDLDTSIPQTYPNPILATPTLQKEVVTLPEGMTVNPSSGAGLSACSEQQYAEEAAPDKTAEEKAQGHGCPNSSKLATVKIKTPSIAEEVTGSAYLAEPAPRGEAGKNPFNTLLSLYLVARAADRGVLVKAPGKVELNPQTGRITTTFGPTPEFDGNPASPGLPPLPASDIKFEFNQGANAPLVTPPTCGSYTVTAELTPWSNPEGNPLDPSIPPFPIFANCPTGNVPPFNPGVTAYPVHGNAGAYSPLYLKITRNDGEQEITGFATAFPPGLTGNLSGVAECSEAQVQRAREQTGVEAETSPACPQNSEIGYSIAEAGVGSVLAQNPGKIYLGGPYDGAPFSVVSVTAAHVGPFDLGTVVVHFPLDINPETADVTIPASPADRIPHIIKGIVVHVRSVRVYVNRNDFMLNPTSCNPSTLSATVLGNGPSGNTVTVADPFQVADCANLAFKPTFQVSTAGKASKADGASLNVKLTFPPTPPGSEANVHYVKVELPKQLPSELRTIQKACLAKVFEANPESCPAASKVGHAKAITPILPVPLEGPAYLVSHGGEAFPSLTVVLRGYGVRIDLVGSIFISKSGITSNTFKTVPDQPVTSFELTLPQGPFSALGTDLPAKAKYSLCGQKLIMPTHFIAQNGREIHQNTPISVTGCHKTKKKTKKARKKGLHKRHK